MNITEFLLARIAEDEAEARGLQGEMDFGLESAGDRMLAECAAKRAIIEQYEAYGAAAQGVFGVAYIGARSGQRVTEDALRALAAVYKDHPDYQEEWTTRQSQE